QTHSHFPTLLLPGAVPSQTGVRIQNQTQFPMEAASHGRYNRMHNTTPMRAFALTLTLLSPALYGAVEFNRDVRPILADKCYNCHAADAASKKIQLRLDKEAAAKADLGGRRAVVEGDPDSSQMIRRITSENKAQRMPPVYSGLKLTAAEIETLRQWVAQGAKWQKHWSFIPPVRPPLPAVKNVAWVRNPIDASVLQKLERKG